MNTEAIFKKIMNQNDADIYVFVGSIDDGNADKLIKLIRNNLKKRKNCILILTTYGGDPDASYRVVREIKRNYSKFILYCFGSCKSSGTLIALGADEIVMSDFSEFGPLDIQLAKDDELSNTSGLNFLQSLESLNEQIFISFEKNFLSLKRKSGGTITTKTAAEISSKLAIGLISPISAQIDPIKLGEVQRSILIAQEYGKRICKKEESIAKLIVGYPCHSFVIDFEEAKDIFANVRWRNEDEYNLEESSSIFRKEGSQDIILLYEIKQEENVVDENKASEEESEKEKIGKKNGSVEEKNLNEKFEESKVNESAQNRQFKTKKEDSN